MEANEMIEFLKQDGIHVIDASQNEYRISHTSNNTTIYFWGDCFYDSYSNSEGNNSYDNLLKRLSTIIRIEKRIDSEYYPIWTKEDGLINQTDKFVKLKGRYYTVEFLEQLIDKIIEFKKINI